MPLYSYKCPECGAKRDEFRKMADRDNAPECHGPMTRILTAFRVIADIEPYQAVGLPGKPWIHGRRQHRDALKDHDKIEVGTDWSEVQKVEERGAPESAPFEWQEVADGIA